MKIALFGSTGFVGQHLLNDLDTEVIPVNIRVNAWESQITEDVNAFINCIGKAHDHKGTATEKDYYDANFEIVKDIFDVFKKSKAEMFIHISSLAAVEETERKETITEESVCNPVSFYGKSKRAAENFLSNEKLPAGKKVIILRPTMIHGLGDKGNLGLLHKMISKGIPYPLAAFRNSRTFLYIENFVFFINSILKNIRLMESGIYNVSDDEPVSTRNIIEIIGSSEGKKIRLLPVPKSLIIFVAGIGDVLKLPLNTQRLKKMTSNLVVSNNKIKNTLKLQNLPFTAENGLKKTIKSFRN